MPPETEAVLERIADARRQIEICNACRYCEGYCAVFPAITRQRMFSDGDITQLANLCHNCRGCYYACQYTEPHEFALNVPKVLAEVRADSWERFAWPQTAAGLFQRSGAAIAILTALALTFIIAAIQSLRPESGEGFYAFLSHSAMVAIFTPAFILPLTVIAAGLRRYWQEIGGAPVRLAHLVTAARDAARLKQLSGGQGQGCNYERGDRYSSARRHSHQAAMWGFLLCFASTSTATIMHYVLDWPAPYGFFSVPKLLGLPGGLLLVAGCAGLVWLKSKADPELGAPSRWGGEMGFVILLGLAGFTGLLLYAATGSALVSPMLALHLGTVLALFLITPYSKMAHGFYRFAALVREAQLKG